MRIRLIKNFLKYESSSSLILLLATILSIMWVNSPLESLHSRLIDASIFWINDGLMAIFFLIVGLELKHGYVDGQLSKASQILLPGVAALGGMIVPALIYCLFNLNSPDTLRGWATPVATDIAFALGALSVFGKRVPNGLKLFLMALAIFDDIGAICIITFFYANSISLLSLLLVSVLILCLYLLNRLDVKFLTPYMIIGIGLWVTLIPTGIHPTIAGVVLAFFIPAEGRDGDSLLINLKNKLNPLVAFFIVPLFVLANAGFPLKDITLDIFSDVVILGIIFGLFVGKQLGVLLSSWLVIKLRLSKLPAQVTWLQMYGVALLCGIGFTMSLFLGTLSFQYSPTYLTDVRLGVICGSILSALSGIIVLKIAFGRNRS